MYRTNRQPLNTMAELLKPIAAQNMDFMRQVAATSRQKRDFRMANRADVQARRWADVVCKAPKGF